MEKASQIKAFTKRNWTPAPILIVSKLLSSYGDRPVADISTQDIQQFLNDRKERSRKTLLSLKKLLGEIFKDAVEDGLSDTDQTKSRRIVISSTKVKIREALPLDEFKEILSSISGLAGDDRRLMALMLFTGMRRGKYLVCGGRIFGWMKD